MAEVSASLAAAIENAKRKTYIDDGKAVALLRGGTEHEISEFVFNVGRKLDVKLNWHKECSSAIVLFYGSDTEKVKVKNAIFAEMEMFPNARVTFI